MARGILSTLTTVAISGAVGFGAGVYATPPDKADAFRALVNSELEEINSLLHRERAAIEPEAKAPSQAAARIAPEVAPNEIQSAVPAQPAAEAPAADTTGREYMPDNNAIRPSVSPTESSDSPPTPAPSAEPVAPATSATPATPTNAENVEQPKPAEHHPDAAPAAQTPPAAAPAFFHVLILEVPDRLMAARLYCGQVMHPSSLCGLGYCCNLTTDFQKPMSATIPSGTFHIPAARLT
jgi:hypothetical protein